MTPRVSFSCDDTGYLIGKGIVDLNHYFLFGTKGVLPLN